MMMKKGGVGGGRTITGLLFESRISISDVISITPGYCVKGDDVYFGKDRVATFYPKHKLYKNLLGPKGIDYTQHISSKLLPDDAILIHATNKLFIVEIKFQEVGGSVDEKLQTCDFKNRQYKKLLGAININVQYAYVLNDWFKNARYKDVLKYIRSVDCHYFFNELPFSFLGLPAPQGKL